MKPLDHAHRLRNEYNAPPETILPLLHASKFGRWKNNLITHRNAINWLQCKQTVNLWAQWAHPPPLGWQEKRVNYHSGCSRAPLGERKVPLPSERVSVGTIKMSSCECFIICISSRVQQWRRHQRRDNRAPGNKFRSVRFYWVLRQAHKHFLPAP